MGEASGDDVPPVELGGAVWRLLTEWLPANDDSYRPRMTVATVDAAGRPDARTLLLSEFDRTGFFFHTDARSRKVTQLARNPGVALSMLWPDGSRQLVVQALAEPAPAAELRTAFAARTPYLQTLSWLNTANFAELPRAERVARWAAFCLEHADGIEQPPPTWVGYRARPSRVTFWEGDPDTASRRTEFTAGAGGWVTTLLAG